MHQYRVLEGDAQAGGLRVAIVASRYNETIVERLLNGCIGCLHSCGVQQRDIMVVRAPGAFEIPLLAKALASKGNVDAIIALGAVIRGDTPHFEYISSECARGIADTALQFNLPVVFGVLTVDDYEQAMLRSGNEECNKGVEAAMTAVETASVLGKIHAGE